ncbi:MAG: HNH endonuclease [Hyphomicrobium sp.]|jgi:hypothetical protein
MNIDAARLREVLEYSEDTGVFTWKLAHARHRRPGAVAGCSRKDGRRLIQLFGRRYLSSRLAWIYVHGTPPQGEVDHANRDKSDDRMCNLRVATRSENCRNMKSANASGFRGVCLVAGQARWRAKIRVNGSMKHLGCFDSPEKASEAYRSAAAIYHGEFACFDSGKKEGGRSGCSHSGHHDNNQTPGI